MASPIPCVPCCATTQTINVPGIQGNSGTDGADGISSYAILGGAGLAAIPADGANTGSLLFSGPGTSPTSWMVVGMYVILGQGPGAALANPGPYTFEIASVDDATHATLTRRAAANYEDITRPAFANPVQNAAFRACPRPLASGRPTAWSADTTRPSSVSGT